MYNNPWSFSLAFTKYAYPLIFFSGNTWLAATVSIKTKLFKNSFGVTRPYANSTVPSIPTTAEPLFLKEFSSKEIASIQVL